MTTPDRIFAAEQALRGDLDGWLHDHTEQEGDCLIWQGWTSGAGSRPAMALPSPAPRQPGTKKKKVLVRRVIWETINGVSLPDHYRTWVKCGHPLCVNPAHIVATTRKEMEYMMARQGRFKRDDMYCAVQANRAQGRSKLTWDDVNEIRAVLDSITPARYDFERGCVEGISRHQVMRDLAQRYGVSFSAIKAIVHGERWKAPPATQNPFSQLLKLAA